MFINEKFGAYGLESTTVRFYLCVRRQGFWHQPEQ